MYALIVAILQHFASHFKFFSYSAFSGAFSCSSLSYGTFIFDEHLLNRRLCLFTIFRIQLKPECYTVFKVVHTIILVERFHNGLYDGQANSIAPIFPGMCLIHFVELVPQLVQIFFRYGVTAVEYRYPYRSSPGYYPDFDTLFVIHMMDRIG